MTTTPVSETPISVDYTGRDYYAIREELIARIQDRIPTWTGTNPADFGVALVEAFAYMGDLMSYYIDRNVSESFISTATQRESVINIAQTYGYIPSGYRQSYVNVIFSNSSETISYTIPKGTVVSGDVTLGDTVNTVYFTTTSDVICNPDVDNGQATNYAGEGRSVTFVSDYANTYGELVGTSDGTPNQLFELGETPVVDGSLTVYVKSGSKYSKWRQVQHLIDYGPNDQIYSATTDADGIVTINFGDGASGLIPTKFAEVRVLYTVGGGTLGNIVGQTLDTIVYVPGLSTNELIALQGVITVSNTESGLGGANPESLSQIRYAAPLTLRANTRAVTLEDFNSIALGVSGIGKAQAIADIWTSVTLYVAPSRDEGDADLQPGLDEENNPTVEYDAMEVSVLEALDNKTLIGTTVSIQPPTYVDVIVAIQYSKLPQYTSAEVEAAIKSAMVTEYGYYNIDFADTIYQQDIEYTLKNVSGVKVAKLTQLHVVGDTGLDTITANAGEIFRFQEGNISIGSI